MGAVWAARNEVTSRDVAIKLLIRPDPHLRERLLREARACGAIRHRNVVDIYDADETEKGEPFLVMPLLHGETLSALIRRKRRLAPPEAARIARDIARGLQAAHELGVVHRDLKPSNIFLHTEPDDTELVVKILDFGVSKILSSPGDFRTATGMLVGSLPYMSPEQVRALPDIDHRVDLWTLGIVLFEMLTGERPIQGKAHEMLMRVIQAEIPPVSQYIRQIDPGLEAVVTRCLQRDRALRPRSAADVAAELEQYISRAAALCASGSEWRAATPSAPPSTPPIEPPCAPEAAVFGPAGALFATRGAPASWDPPDDATTVPRPTKQQNPLLGEHGTIKLTGQQALAQQPWRASSAPLKALFPVAPLAAAALGEPAFPAAPAMLRAQLQNLSGAAPLPVPGLSPSQGENPGSALRIPTGRSLAVLALAAAVLTLGLVATVSYLVTQAAPATIGTAR